MSGDMARIAYITSTYPDYEKCGTGIYAGYLTQALAQQGHEIHIITTAIPEIKNTFGKIQIHKIMKSWNPTDLPRFFQTMAQIQPDLVHINHPTSIAAAKSKVLVNLLPGLIKGTWQIPVVTTIHEFNNLSLLGRLKIMPMLLASEAITVTNEAYKKSLMEHIPEGLHHRINVIDIGALFAPNLQISSGSKEREKWGLKPTDKVIGFVGFITPPKGFHNLIESAGPLLKSHPEYKILALSSWNQSNPAYRQKILDLIDKHGITNQVIHTGYLDDQSLWEALSAVDLAAFPFDFPVEERSSATLRQVLYHGRPTIVWANNIDYQEHGLRHGKNIWLSPHKNSGELRKNIQFLMEDEPTRKLLAEGTTVFKDELGFDRISNEFSRLYTQLL